MPNPAVRQQIASLASDGFLTEARSIVQLGRPAPRRPTCRSGTAPKPPNAATGCCSRPPPTGSPGSPTPIAPASYPANLVRLRRYGLIIVDEVGYLPFEQDAANLFFQLVSSRYEHASLILTSNLPFSGWGRRLRGPGRRRRHDRPHRQPRRRPHVEGASYRLRNRGVDSLPSARTTTSNEPGWTLHNQGHQAARLFTVRPSKRTRVRASSSARAPAGLQSR